MAGILAWTMVRAFAPTEDAKLFACTLRNYLSTTHAKP
jgi:hypothetical protein